VFTQIIINRLQDVLAQITEANFFSYERTRTNKRCVLTQLTINRFQDVLAQITRDIFFYERKGQIRGVCWHNHN
jgi:transcription initiation factor IIE alpha subunit